MSYWDQMTLHFFRTNDSFFFEWNHVFWGNFRDVYTDRNLQTRTAMLVKSSYTTKVEVYVQTEIKVIKCIAAKADCYVPVVVIKCLKHKNYNKSHLNYVSMRPSRFLFLFLLKCESCVMHRQLWECRVEGSALPQWSLTIMVLTLWK